jgi:hypothetical protein
VLLSIPVVYLRTTSFENKFSIRQLYPTFSYCNVERCFPYFPDNALGTKRQWDESSETNGTLLLYKLTTTTDDILVLCILDAVHGTSSRNQGVYYDVVSIEPLAAAPPRTCTCTIIIILCCLTSSGYGQGSRYRHGHGQGDSW